MMSSEASIPNPRQEDPERQAALLNAKNLFMSGNSASPLDLANNNLGWFLENKGGYETSAAPMYEVGMNVDDPVVPGFPFYVAKRRDKEGEPRKRNVMAWNSNFSMYIVFPEEITKRHHENFSTAGFVKTGLTKLPLLDFVDDGSGNRWLQMGGLLHDVLKKYQSPKILDLAMGTGQDSISLLKEGYDVESNDIDEEGIKIAEKFAKEANVDLHIHRIDWKDFLNTSEFATESLDVVFSLGNSFPNYMFDAQQRVEALKGFWRILKKGGTLVFDTRNFDYILENKETILKDPEKNFDFGYRSTYVNRQVKGFPVDISKDRLHYIWKHYKNKTWAELDLWPATIQNVQDLIHEALEGVSVKIYYDYKTEKPAQFDFVQYVLQKN